MLFYHLVAVPELYWGLESNLSGLRCWRGLTTRPGLQTTLTFLLQWKSHLWRAKNSVEWKGVDGKKGCGSVLLLPLLREQSVMGPTGKDTQPKPVAGSVFWAWRERYPWSSTLICRKASPHSWLLPVFWRTWRLGPCWNPAALELAILSWLFRQNGTGDFWQVITREKISELDKVAPQSWQGLYQERGPWPCSVKLVLSRTRWGNVVSSQMCL